MPPKTKTKRDFKDNGEDTRSPSPVKKSKRSKLAERLRPHLKGTDTVEIGWAGYEPDDEDETASWVDVRKLVDNVRWLCKDWVPYGMMTGIVAQPCVGKSGFAVGAVVRPIVTGCKWFTGLTGPKPGNVIWCDTEHSAALNLGRAEEWGLPMDRIKVPFPDDPLRPIDLNNTDHMERLLNVTCRYKATSVVVDSFRGSHGGDENSSKIVTVLNYLGTIAERTKTAMIPIHHARKMAVDEDLSINCARGSNAFLAKVRMQIVMDVPDPKPDPKEEWKRVWVLGENLGIRPKPIGFRFTDMGLEFGDPPTKPVKRTEKDNVEDWLQQRMKPGKVYKASEILEEAVGYGYSKRTVQRVVAQKLGVKPKPVREDGKISEWKWVLP